MAVSALTPDQLRQVLGQTLHPDANIRKAAEAQLTEAQKNPGHPLAVLHIVASNDAADAPVRQAAAVHFKNMVKKGWATDHEENDSGIQISREDRVKIKDNLVELMCTVPPQIQAQCAEAISLIATVDFPKNWDNLLPQLVHKMQSPDPAVVNGVLVSANSILKRFRYGMKSDALYADLIYVLKHLQEPLLLLFKSTGAAVDALANDAVQLKPRMEALRTMCRIFFSLNWQDLPEYFEDHMTEWMEQFAKYLQYQNPVLVDETEEEETGPIDKLQAAIVENLTLYANKDEEPFLPFLPQFTSLVWNLLLRVTAFPKHDGLATTSMRFLASLIQKTMHKHLFQEKATLQEIIAKIVIPNLMLRTVDQERFEDDPQEFIQADLESHDNESRRTWAQALLKAMCRQFETETTEICSQHVGTMLNEFASDPQNKWTSKDAAIHLMFGIAIRAEAEMTGISELNPAVNVLDFFTTHVYPELQEKNQLVRPMIKATSLKFVLKFRNQFDTQQLSGLMPLLVAHLSSPSVVVHTYAAAAIEKILTAKDTLSDGKVRRKIGGTELQPHLTELFNALFAIVDNVELNENSYVMKCVMRSLHVARDDVAPVTQVVLEKLTQALARVAKNPRNPQYNHYLFESVAVLVGAVCSKDPGATSAFEPLVFPPFQSVLQLDVVEFVPYVFQVLAQLLEYRPSGAGLGEAYTVLFPPLLIPLLWERKGNIPALTRLLQAYLDKAATVLASENQLLGILGVFQKLLSSKANEVHGVHLLCSIIQNLPLETIQPHLKSIFQILLTRLQHKKTPRYVGLLTNFFALFVGKFGAQVFLDELNAVQPGLGLMLISQVWITRLASDLPKRLDAKIHLIGLTKLLCDTPALLADTSGQQVWGQILAGIVSILASPDTNLFMSSKTNLDEDTEVAIEYDATFSRLHFASQPVRDPFAATVQDPTKQFVVELHGLCQSQPGRFQPIIEQCLQSNPKYATTLGNLLKSNGLSLA